MRMINQATIDYYTSVCSWDIHPKAQRRHLRENAPCLHLLALLFGIFDDTSEVGEARRGTTTGAIA